MQRVLSWSIKNFQLAAQIHFILRPKKEDHNMRQINTKNSFTA